MTMFYLFRREKIMGLLGEILKALSNSENVQDKDKRINEKLFMDEAKAYGLTNEEIEECKKSGVTPEEWVQDQDK